MCSWMPAQTPQGARGFCNRQNAAEKEMGDLSWARFDDGYCENEKILEAGPMAEFLDFRAILFCSRNETDGRVTRAALKRLSQGIPKPLEQAARLVEVGRWSADEMGWWVHDFLEFNPSKADREAARDATRDRVRRHRQREATSSTGSNSDVTRYTRVSNAPCNADVLGVGVGVGGTESLNKNCATNQTNGTEPTKPTQTVRVFLAWIEATDRDESRTKLSPARAKRIDQALKAYPLDDVLDAVRGVARSPFHMGRNDRAKRFDDLDLILRDAAHIEEFRDLQRNERAVPVYDSVLAAIADDRRRRGE